MYRRWNNTVVKGQHCFEQAGNARCGIYMADIAFDRAERTAARCAFGKDLGQCGHLDRVADCSARCMGLDHGDACRRGSRKLLRFGNDPHLWRDAGRSKAYFFGPIIVDCRTSDHRIYRVAGGLCVGKSF